MENLKWYDEKGLIPGPEETEADFLKRATYCLSLKDSIAEELKEKIPFNTPEEHPECFKKGMERSQELYGISPDWVPVFYSSHGLTPWHGGCAWIFQKEKNAPTSAFLQLRKSFQKTKKFLGIYDRSELIAHELCHVGRMKFEEPRFEEIFAYQTSPSSLRRFFGPIIQSGWESMLFVALLFLIFLLDIYLFLFGSVESYYQFIWLKTIPLILLSLSFARLFIRHRQLKRCREHIAGKLRNPNDADKVLFRLTDHEILNFPKSDSSLRWRVLKTLYFK